jgi:hypothetical protein
MRTIAILVMGVLVLACAFLLLVPVHTSKAENELSFVLPHSFDKVKKAMIKGKVLEEVLEAQKAKLLFKEVKYIHLSSERLLSGWEADVCIAFKILIPNKDIGDIRLDLIQFIKANKDSMEGHVYNQNESRGVVGVHSDIKMQRDGDNTSVRLQSSLVFQHRVPFFWKEYMDAQVKAAMVSNGQNSKAVIEKVVERSSGDKRFNLILGNRRKR